MPATANGAAMERCGERRLWRVAFLAGLAAAVVIVGTGRVAASDARLGADVTVAAQPSGELAFSRQGPFLNARRLAPGRAHAVRAAVTARNQTGRALAIRVRALPSTRDLDRLLQVELGAAGRVLYRGPLGGLRAWSPTALGLAPAHEARLSLRAWLAPATAAASDGRIVDVGLEFRSRVVAR